MKHRTKDALKKLNQSQAISYNSKFVQQTIEPYVKKSIPSSIWYNLCAQGVDIKKIPIKKFKKPTIIYAGKYTVEKGAHLVRKIARLIPEANFVMFGESKNKIKKKQPSNVTALKYITQEEVFSYMKSADIFISPALWHEPFGRFLLEAQAMGAASIVSARGGMQSDIVKHNKTGIIVEDVSAKGFAKEIKSLLKNKKKRLQIKKQARADFLKRFNEKVIVKQFMDLAHKIMH